MTERFLPYLLVGVGGFPDLPVVIEIVDAEERIRAFSPTIAEVITEGMVTLETMRVLKYVSLDAAHR